jgi:alanine racemase
MSGAGSDDRPAVAADGNPVDTRGLALWAEVDLARVRRNTERLRGLLSPATRLLAVVKADGYGHGAVPVARAALSGGAEWLGVARVPEGAALREAGIQAPVLLLAEQPDAAVPLAVALGLAATVYTRQGLACLAAAAQAAARTVAVHVKVDTGMHRYGAAPEDVPALIDAARRTPGVRLEGIWSHFAVAEDVLNPYTKQQFELFTDVLEALGPAAGGLIRHLANSAGLLTLPEAHFDLVRSGIAVYGIHPSPELADRVVLEPAISFKSRVGLTKVLEAGASVSYGQRYAMPRRGTVATVPAGYADGVRRGLTNTGEVLIGGRRRPISGSVTMDHLMADLGADTTVRPGDEVVLVGRQGAEEISAHDVAAWLGTIPYEVVCAISSRVPRVYLPDA